MHSSPPSYDFPERGVLEPDSDVLKPFANAVSTRVPLAVSERLYVLTSGGPDSVLLALATRAACKNIDCEPVLVHYDHQLRESAKEDRRFVERLGEWLGVETVVRELEVAEFAESSGLGIEGAARKLRLRETEAITGEGSPAVDGHHRDDQGETVALQAVRGAGAVGGRGIRDCYGGYLYRPLLGFRKRDLRNALEELGVPYREDPSNRHPGFLRNRIRHGYLDDGGARTERLLDLGERSQRLDRLLQTWHGACELCRVQPADTPRGLVKRALLDRLGWAEYRRELLRLVGEGLGGAKYGLRWWLYLWLRDRGMDRSRSLVEEAAGQLLDWKRFQAAGVEIRPSDESFFIGPVPELPETPTGLGDWREWAGLDIALGTVSSSSRDSRSESGAEGGWKIGTRTDWREHSELGRLYSKDYFRQQVQRGLRDFWPVLFNDELGTVRIIGSGEWLSADEETGGTDENGVGESLPGVDIADQ